MSDIQIVLDERIRNATAVLAASNWPAIEQEIKPHAVHPHTKQTRQFVEGQSNHPAVAFVNSGLAEEQAVDALLTALVLGEERATLDAFASQSKLASLWAAHAPVWDTAVSECQQIFENCPLPTMLAQMGGKTDAIRLMPTLTYPMLEPAVIASAGETAVVLPPPKAWGESPPWPFKEDPIWVVVEAGKAILTHGLQPVWTTQSAAEQRSLVQAGVALCLEKMFDDFERQAYIVRIKKEENIQSLPQLTTQLRDWLSGDRTNSIVTLL